MIDALFQAGDLFGRVVLIGCTILVIGIVIWRYSAKGTD